MDWPNATGGIQSATIHASTTARDLAGNESEDDPELMLIHHSCFLVMYYATSLIVPFGILGNVFSITVFLSAANFRRTSTAQYLIALAFTDSLYLVGELVYTVSTPDPWGDFMTSIDFVYTTDAGCKSVMWLRYSTKLMSSWITVAIMLERMLAVSMPLRVAILSTPCRARLLLTVLCITCGTITAYPMWTVGSRPDEDGNMACLVISDSYEIWHIIMFIVGSMVLPEALLIVFSVVIVFQLANSRKQREQLTPFGASEHAVVVNSTTYESKSNGTSSAHSTDRQLTVMLATVCVTAFTLQLPYIVLYNVNKSKYSWLTSDSVAFEVLLDATLISLVFSTLNYAVNFLLYYVSGSSFRSHVVRLVFRCNHRCRREDERRQLRCTSATAEFQMVAASPRQGGARVALLTPVGDPGSRRTLGLTGSSHVLNSVKHNC